MIHNARSPHAQVTFHTGDPWGRGTVDGVSFELHGSAGRLTSSQCVLTVRMGENGYA